MDEESGEVLSQTVLAQRVGWCADLVAGMVSGLLAERWNCADVEVLASGQDAGGRKLPSNAWMALRRLGWTVTAPEGVKVNDRIVRMAQEQAGRALRSASWRAELTAGVLATWPADPRKRTAQEWEQVRKAVPGGEHLPSSIVKSRTRQAARFLAANGRLPVDVFELEGVPKVARMLLLAACDRQQATIERSDTDPSRVLLRLQLPTRPDPRAYADWTWVACPIMLPPTVPADAVLHLPTLRLTGRQVRADLAYTHAVSKAQRTGHTVAVGVDWGLNTLLSAGALRLHEGGRVTALGAGGQFRAAGILAKQHRLRRHGERLHAKADHYQRLTGRDERHQLVGKLAVLRDEIRHVSDRRTNLNAALASPHHPRLEVGDLPPPVLPVAGRPRPGRLAADRRPRPDPSGQDRHRQGQRAHGHPRRGRQTRNGSGHHDKPPGGTGRRPAPPGASHHAPRPGDAGHPPPPGPTAGRVSVRRDTHQRTG
ncbi:hypothetical protein ONA91_28435 [Micromonospora sp. DR5-3]|uniref:hypothetical protein n=1 Tax=Micromonospora sp. DR5-3 TaxID=2992129 RepID=UPI00222E5635|nr:hypothetical protein [Micromonospora sp. DR5-3]MCW3818382.1 hypothetical protein [Micromonospora sp. DR5-3]